MDGQRVATNRIPEKTVATATTVTKPNPDTWIDAHAVAAAIHGQRVCSGADATRTAAYSARMNKPIQSN